MQWNTENRLDQVMEVCHRALVFACGCVGTSSWVEEGRVILFPALDCPNCGGLGPRGAY